MATAPDWLGMVFEPPRVMVLPITWWQGTARGLTWIYWYGSPNIAQNVTPIKDCKYDLGKSDKRFRNVFACYGEFSYRVETDTLHALEGKFDEKVNTDTVLAEWGYFDSNVYVQGKRVLKDYDPIQLYAFIDSAKSDISLIHAYLSNIQDLLTSESTKIEELKSNVQEIKSPHLSLIEHYLDLIKFYASRIETIEQEVSLIKEYTKESAKWSKPASGILSIVKTVTTLATPLYPEELDVKRILCRIPSNTTAVIYMGDKQNQYFPLFAGEKIELNVRSPKNVYVKATEEVNIYCLFEVNNDVC